MLESELRNGHALTIAESAPEYINLLGALWRRKFWLLVTLLLAWSAGAAAYLLIPKTYQSEAQLLVMHQSLDVRTSGSNAADVTRSTAALHEEVLSSPVVVGRAVEQYDLLKLASLRSAPKPLEQITESLRTERQAANPYENQDSLFTLSYRATAPEDPPRVLAALIATFTELLNEIERENRAAAKPILTKWRDQVAAQLSVKEDAYRRMQHIPEHLDAADVASMDVPQARLARLEAQKQEWSVRRAQIQRQLMILQEAQQQGIDAALLAELEARWAPQLNGQNPLNDSLAFLLNKEQELVAQYGPRHPSVLAIREQLGGVRPSLGVQPLADPAGPVEASDRDPRRTVEVHVAALEKEMEVASAVERVLELSLEETRLQVAEAARVAQQAELIRAEITQLQQLHRDLVNQLEMADFDKDTQYYATRMLAAPSVARKVAPSATMLAIVATALGGCGGALVALLRDVTDRRLRTAERVERTMQLNVLGQIPRQRGRGTRAGRQRRLHRHLILGHRPDSPAAEALRSALWAVLCAGDRAGGLQTLQVTGVGQSVGTSLTAANLACAAAETGRRVLLVDANLRTPGQRQLFGLADDAGLEDVLRGSASAEQVIQPTPVRGLYVLGARPAGGSPTNLLYSPAFRELLQTLCGDYDLILIDTPSPLQVTDAYMVARQVDGVLFVVQPQTRGPAAQQCRRVLASIDARVLGAVMNCVPRGRSRGFQPLASLPAEVARPGRVVAKHENGARPAPVAVRNVIHTAGTP